MKRNHLLAAISLIAALPLAACNNDAPTAEAGAAAAANAGMVDALADQKNLTTVNGAIKRTGLAGIFDGKGSYSVFAPTDEAFKALGDTGLDQPENQAALAALLREHIAPGALTLKDINSALDSAKGEPVALRTVGTGSLRISRDGDKLKVTAPDGATAHVAGEAIQTNNGMIIPIDKVLRGT